MTVGSNTCQGWDGLSRWHSRPLMWQNNGIIWCHYPNNAEEVLLGHKSEKSETSQAGAGDLFKTEFISWKWQNLSTDKQRNASVGLKTFMYYISSLLWNKRTINFTRFEFFLLKWSTWQFVCSDLFLIVEEKKKKRIRFKKHKERPRKGVAGAHRGVRIKKENMARLHKGNKLKTK